MGGGGGRLEGCASGMTAASDQGGKRGQWRWSERHLKALFAPRVNDP